MELVPEIGIGRLKFGISRSEAERILGKPDIERFDGDDSNRKILVFNNESIRLTFYVDENMRLGYIESSNPTLTFKTRRIIGESIDIVKINVLEIENKDWEIENFHSFDTHFFEPTWLTLHSEYEKVTNVELGVPIVDDAYKWPK